MRKGPSRFRDEVWVRPPAAARRVARAILKLRKDLPPSRRGGTEAGLARARSIAAGELQPAREISGWFARHGGYIEDAVAMGKTPETSKALQAQMLWGGWPMLEAVEKALGPQRNPSPPPGFLEGSVYKGTLYHGTDRRIELGHSLSPAFGDEYGIYLSPSHRYARNYGARLARVRVNIKRPLVVESKAEISPRDLTRADVERLERAGYDGIVSGDREVVAFRRDQVWVDSEV